jgi:hypothetical protein
MNLARLRIPLVIISAFFAVTGCLCPAMASNDIDRMKNGDKSILIVDIREGDLIEPKSGYKCFYHYEATVRDRLKGNFDKREFEFYSESELTLGGSYVISFDVVASRLYRPAGDAVISDGEFTKPGGGRYCASRMTALFFVYDEIHELKDIWNGHSLEKVVSFNNTETQFPKETIREDRNSYVTLSYLKSELESK